MIRKASKRDTDDLAELAMLLWPGHTLQELLVTFDKLLETDSAALFLVFENNQAVGFAQCQLRRDYVEGTESSPVGYLEGIFVKAAQRSKGCARALLEACEAWSAAKGCREFASDCALDNDASRQFHLRAGFAEANRIICFTKKL